MKTVRTTCILGLLLLLTVLTACTGTRTNPSGDSDLADNVRNGQTDGQACDYDAEGYDFMGESEQECSTIRFTCPLGTVYFQNSCGCGCQGTPVDGQ